MTDVDDRQRWNERYEARDRDEPADRSAGPEPNPPTPLLRMVSLLPGSGRAVDLAGGDGGAGLLLARRGLATTVVDVSDVGLRRAEWFGRRHELDLHTVRLDLRGRRLSEVLEAVGPPAPSVVTCFNFLDRTLLASVATDLPSGCRFLAAVATVVNLERHERPPARFLLDRGELESLVVGEGVGRLRLLHRREGWADDRHRAEIAVEAR